MITIPAVNGSGRSWVVASLISADADELIHVVFSYLRNLTVYLSCAIDACITQFGCQRGEVERKSWHAAVVEEPLKLQAFQLVTPTTNNLLLHCTLGTTFHQQIRSKV